jgi:hypothetical protein
LITDKPERTVPGGHDDIARGQICGWRRGMDLRFLGDLGADGVEEVDGVYEN